MSSVERSVKLSPPSYPQPIEVLRSEGLTCGCCHGNGWFWREARGEYEKKPCPVCKGSGTVDAVVTIEWNPNVKHINNNDYEEND